MVKYREEQVENEVILNSTIVLNKMLEEYGFETGQRVILGTGVYHRSRLSEVPPFLLSTITSNTS